MHRFINRHLGVPEPTANIVTTNIAKSLRSYFLAVTIIAAFNAILIGGAALILGVPLAGTIAVVTFVGAYVPFVGAWVAGGFAVLIALSTGSTSDALIMAVVALLANGILQQMIQPFVMGATLSLNPLVVLVVTIGAGCLFGMIGLTLAAPLTSAAVHIANELQARSSGAGARLGERPAGAVRLTQFPWRRWRRSWICARSVSHRDRAWPVTSSHWRWTSSSAGRSPRWIRSSSSRTSRPTAAEPTTATMAQKSAEIIANTAPITP